MNIKSLTWNQCGAISAILLAFVIPISTAATNIFGLLTVVFWLVGDDRQEKWRLVLAHPLAKWIYLFIALALIGVSYSVADSRDIRHGLTDALRLGLIPVLMYYFRSHKIASMALWAFALAMVLTLILAYLKVYAGLPIGLKYTTGAVFKSHIKTSYFMAMAAFFFALKAKENPAIRMPLVITIVLMIYYLLCMSIGRIGYLTLVLGILVLAWQWYRMKGLLSAALLASIMIATAYFTSDLFHQRINLLSQDLDFYHQGSQGGNLLQSSLGSRITFATGSVELMMEKPLLGYGTGSFGTVYEKHHEGVDTLLTDNPHNEYLRMGVEFGLVGLCVLLMLFAQQWRYGSMLAADKRDLWQGVFLTYVMGCFINSWLMDFTEAYFFCLMTAICFANLRLSGSHVRKAIA